MDYLCCDNYGHGCTSSVPIGDTLENARERARIAGWKVWSGKTEGGADHNIVLCLRCQGTRRRLADVEHPEGEQHLF